MNDFMEGLIRRHPDPGKLLDITIPIPPDEFPQPKLSKEGLVRGILGTIDNLTYLLNRYGYRAFYNEITKTTTIEGPGITESGIQDGQQDAAINKIISQAALCGFPLTNVQGYLDSIARDNSVNPVRDFLSKLAWDGNDHIGKLCKTIQVDRSSVDLRDEIIRLWLIQACAAADGGENTPNKDAVPKYEYAFVFFGAQGKGKTKWFGAIVPEQLQVYFKDGVHLDPGNKDSVEKVVGFWIVELGELDSTFKKDVARLKAFLSEQSDVFRKSYGRTRNSYKRRTCFCGSVNRADFLRDETGNRRYWPLAVETIKLPVDCDIDVCQVWAQSWHLYMTGAQWWPTPELETLLDSHRNSFQAEIEHPILQEIHKRYGELTPDRTGADWLSASEIFDEVAPIGQDADQRTLNLISNYMMQYNLDEYGKPNYKKGKGKRHWAMPDKWSK